MSWRQTLRFVGHTVCHLLGVPAAIVMVSCQHMQASSICPQALCTRAQVGASDMAEHTCHAAACMHASTAVLTFGCDCGLLAPVLKQARLICHTQTQGLEGDDSAAVSFLCWRWRFMYSCSVTSLLTLQPGLCVGVWSRCCNHYRSKTKVLVNSQRRCLSLAHRTPPDKVWWVVLPQGHTLPPQGHS